MWKDLFLQALMFSVTIFMFLWTLNYPQKLYHKLRLRLRKQPPNLQAKRQFVLAAHLLSQSNRSKSSSASDLLNEALSAADEAASLDPKDAAAHILKALILELQGFYSSAIDSLDAALSPLAVKSLSHDERSDALCKRAQLKLAPAPAGGRLDSAIVDLLESVKMMNKNGAGKAFGLLGECYEKKGLKMEAQKAYQDAIRVQPNYFKARLALDRLRSSSSSSS